MISQVLVIREAAGEEELMHCMAAATHQGR